MTTENKIDESLQANQAENIEQEEGVEKHYLENTWTLWYHNPQAKLNEQNYSQFFSEVYSVSDVETFWRFVLFASVIY